MSKMVTNLTYDVKKNSYEVVSDIKEEKIKEILLEFLRLQMGLGKDTREAAIKDIYKISITLDLEDDSFQISHDCGNEGLAAGIIMQYCSKR